MPDAIPMCISLPGVLERAAETCKRSRGDQHLEWPLRKLLTDIRELRQTPTPDMLTAFLELWSDQSG